MDVWLLLALQLAGTALTAAAFGLGGAFMWSKGVTGATRKLEIALDSLQIEIDDVRAQQNRFSKQRASDISSDVRADRKSLADEAMERLSEIPAQQPKIRPSVYAAARGIR